MGVCHIHKYLSNEIILGFAHKTKKRRTSHLSIRAAVDFIGVYQLIIVGQILHVSVNMNKMVLVLQIWIKWNVNEHWHIDLPLRAFFSLV